MRHNQHSILRFSLVALLGTSACVGYGNDDGGETKKDAGHEHPDAGHREHPDAAHPDLPDAAMAPDASRPDAAHPIPDAGRPDTWMRPPTKREEARAYFEANVLPIMTLEGQHCFQCHSGAVGRTNQENWLDWATNADGDVDNYESTRTWRARSVPLTGELLYNIYEPGQSLILIKGQHAQLAGPAFGTTGTHLTRFIRWVELEGDAAREEGTWNPPPPSSSSSAGSSSTATSRQSSSTATSMPRSSSSATSTMVTLPSSDMGTASSAESPSSEDAPSSAQPESSSTSTMVTMGSSAQPQASSVMDSPSSGGNPLTPDGGIITTVGDPYGGMFHHNVEATLPPDEVLALLASEGPPEFSLRMHGCNKLSYVALGNLLATRGVNLASTAAGSAATIYNTKAAALGAADFSKAEPESRQLSTGGAAKLFDILLQSSSEIMANMSARTDCMDPDNLGGSVGNQAQLFNTTACANQQVGCCLESGFTCLLGQPVTEDHLAYCDRIVASTISNTNMSIDPVLGKQVAIATMLSGSFICE